MKPAIFHLANLNLTVTISPDARRWVQEHIVSLETYAWAQADVFKRGGDVDKGVHVEFIEKPHECRTVADLKGAKREKPPAPVADTYHTKKTEKIVRGEDAFEPIGTMPVVGDTFDLANSSGHVISRNKVEKLNDLSACGPTGAPICDLACFRAAGNGCGWTARILKRERGTELLGARVLKSRSSIRVFVGDCCYMKCGTWGAGAEPAHVNPEAYVEHCGYTELHGAERESILADPALLALVGKGEA